jgi:hypothetical protein
MYRKEKKIFTLSYTVFSSYIFISMCVLFVCVCVYLNYSLGSLTFSLKNVFSIFLYVSDVADWIQGLMCTWQALYYWVILSSLSFSISCRVGLQQWIISMIVYWNIFISPSPLKDSFSKSEFLADKLFLWAHCLLVIIVSDVKSAVHHIGEFLCKW